MWEEEDTAPESEGSEVPLTGRPKTYLTKMKKITQQSLEKEEKKAKYSRAVAAYRQGGFKSIANCARRYQIPRTTLRDLLASGDEYQGSGRKLHCLTHDEEGEIVDHVKWRAAVGCGVDWHQLQLLVQEVLLGLKIANPERMTGYEGSGQLPNVNFIRRLAERHRLTLRSSSEISKGKNNMILL